MEYFSELYGDYYLAAARVLERAFDGGLTESELRAVVRECVSTEGELYITQQLTGGKWQLLRAEGGRYYPLTRSTPKMPLTLLQRAWLSTLLEDARCTLFLSSAQRAELKQALDTEPLYDSRFLSSADVCSGGDEFTSPAYAERFRLIMRAVKEGRVLGISYISGRGKSLRGSFLPHAVEYSAKDEKFRLRAYLVRRSRPVFYASINLGRITSLVESSEPPPSPEALNGMPRSRRAGEPAVIEIIDGRNALERAMIQLSSFDKRTEYSEESGRYLCSIYYNICDETELLIRLLSFGPLVRVLSPAPFVGQVRERVLAQCRLAQMG